MQDSDGQNKCAKKPVGHVNVFDLAGAGAGAGAGANKEFTFICVMFMDIVNYTELANRYKSGDTIFRLLDNVYCHFDNIIKKYSHLQKIETIGDAYMVVGDIYRRELNHKTVVKEMISLGLDFIREIKTIKTPDQIPLQIRIGINIGNVNIGILGNEIPRLCVVGNAVNMSARLQSTADADSIQISRHVYEQAEEQDMNITYTEKQNVFLKNIGSVTTFMITPSN
jgi:class 3 adenylate cyclase